MKSHLLNLFTDTVKRVAWGIRAKLSSGEWKKIDCLHHAWCLFGQRRLQSRWRDCGTTQWLEAEALSRARASAHTATHLHSAGRRRTDQMCVCLEWQACRQLWQRWHGNGPVSDMVEWNLLCMCSVKAQSFTPLTGLICITERDKQLHHDNVEKTFV